MAKRRKCRSSGTAYYYIEERSVGDHWHICCDCGRRWAFSGDGIGKNGCGNQECGIYLMPLHTYQVMESKNE